MSAYIDYSILDTDEDRESFKALLLLAHDKPISYANILTSTEANDLIAKLTVAQIVAMPHEHDRIQLFQFINQLLHN